MSTNSRNIHDGKPGRSRSCRSGCSTRSPSPPHAVSQPASISARRAACTGQTWPPNGLDPPVERKKVDI